MRQPSLFDSPEKPIEAAPVRLPPIRKYLHSQLRVMRAATTMPWHKADADYHALNFPIYARLFPAEEAAQLIAEFERELARLKAAAT
jgi:hypothetical protein